jgi:protein-L-isoaspartate(D-aspartate) O-methyltransferase
MSRLRTVLALLIAGAFVAGDGGCGEKKQAVVAPGESDDAKHAARRAEMVRADLAARDITDPRVLQAMGRVPRHRFVRPVDAPYAYEDRALLINHGQTISQPYIVALMTQLAKVKPGDRVLDIGTGSGYQAAVLAEMGADVWSIEIIPELAAEAKARLAELNFKNVEVRAGDGYRGWPEHAPFQAIVLAAAAPQVPQPLLDQLAVGGRLVLPVGDSAVQELRVMTKQADGSVQRQSVAPVQFVPMTGEVRGDPRSNP